MIRNRLWPLVIALTVIGLAAGCTTKRSTAQQASDSAITADVKTKLASGVEPATLTKVEVNTRDGVVTLAGTVNTAEAKANAEEIARQVAGVRAVNNRLEVQPMRGALSPPPGEGPTP